MLWKWRMSAELEIKTRKNCFFCFILKIDLLECSFSYSILRNTSRLSIRMLYVWWALHIDFNGAFDLKLARFGTWKSLNYMKKILFIPYSNFKKSKTYGSFKNTTENIKTVFNWNFQFGSMQRHLNFVSGVSKFVRFLAFIVNIQCPLCIGFKRIQLLSEIRSKQSLLNSVFFSSMI